MKKLNHNACIVIENESFFQHLHNAMRPHIKPGTNGGLYNVHYGSRVYHHKKDPNIPISVIKPSIFKYQDESRSIWLPREDKPVEEYLYVRAPMAVLGCRKKPVII